MTEERELRERRFPLGRTVRLDALGVDPYPTLNRLRDQEPVSWVPEVGMWFVTRRDDVLTVLGDYRTFTVDSPHSIIRDLFGRHMMTIDGEEQIHHKRQCMGPFRPRSLEKEMRPWVAAEVCRLVDGMVKGTTAELRLELAKPIALHTVMELLGFPQDDASEMHGWYDRFAASLANFSGDPSVREQGHEAAQAFRRRVESLLDDPRLESRSLLARLNRTESGLSREDIVSNAMIITFGGIETTEAMICNAVWALWSHPDQLQAVRRDPSLIPAAIEESMRWEPAVQSCTRHVTRETTLRGVALGAGDTVQCMIGGANRDPSYFSHADRFDIHRANAKDHLAFGAGRHFCLGAPLAKLEAQLVLEALLERVTLTLDASRPAAPRGYEFRKPPSLWIRWN